MVPEVVDVGDPPKDDLLSPGSVAEDVADVASVDDGYRASVDICTGEEDTDASEVVWLVADTAPIAVGVEEVLCDDDPCEPCT